MPTSDTVPAAPVPTGPADAVERGGGAVGQGERDARQGAVGAWLRFLRSELRLILGRRRNQVGLAVLAAVPIVIAIAVKVADPAAGGDDSTFLNQIAGNGFFVALAALALEIGLFLPLAVAVLAGDSVAGEANVGTLRGLLVVPVTRGRLLAVKYVAMVLGALLGVVLVAVVGLVAGAVLFGLHPVVTLSGTTLGLGAGLVRLALVVLYVTAYLAALGALGLFISTLTEQPMGATVGIIILSTAMWILDSIEQLHWLHPWLLVDHQLALVDLIRDPVYTHDLSLGLLTDLAYAVVFLAAAWARFSSKDVTS
ncbi:ABC transporter permease [Luteimicrobium sp. NPDC057192]|uniref:ABC transporter permease n=1 Tax=Luteimicrobium sp. NPDC057192 TaxID=3346042 RepID=UPI00364322B4